MTLESVEVTARWLPQDGFEPAQFVWNGQTYWVESTGRRWEDADGLHVLCMAGGSRVFELVFQLAPARWMVRPPFTTAHPA